MPLPAADRLQAVIFDAFGTLVQIGAWRSPYRQLQRLMAQHGRPPRPDDVLAMLTTNVGLAGFAAAAGVQVLGEAFAKIELDLYTELSTIQLFDDALPAISALRQAGLKVGVCSNLATPYAIPVRLLLPDLDSYSWSFEVGAVKPDPRIYEHALSALGVEAGRTLFVGDTPEADVHGPQRVGMHAFLLDRGGEHPAVLSIRTLSQLVDGKWLASG
jgi:HAD superfamily hydrolase (TIGR01549 family)